MDEGPNIYCNILLAGKLDKGNIVGKSDNIANVILVPDDPVNPVGLWLPLSTRVFVMHTKNNSVRYNDVIRNII